MMDDEPLAARGARRRVVDSLVGVEGESSPLRAPLGELRLPDAGVRGGVSSCCRPARPRERGGVKTRPMRARAPCGPSVPASSTRPRATDDGMVALLPR